MKKRIISFTVAAMILILSLTACGGTEGSDVSSGGASADSSNAENSSNVENNGKLTVNIVDSGSIFQFAQQIGIADQYFEDSGYDVEFKLVEMQSGPSANEAFAAGEADFCFMGNMPGITGAASDYGIKILGVAQSSDYAGTIVVPADSSVESVEQLKGKKIGTFIGGSWHYITAVYLESVGLTLDDVELLNTANETATGIRTGEIDAGVMAPETAQELVDEGSGKIIAEKCGEPIMYTISAREDFINEYPEITEDYLRAVRGIYEYIDAHLDEYYDFIEEKSGADSASSQKVYALTEHTARGFTEEELEAQQNLADWMKEQGFIDQDFNLDDVYDLSFIEKLDSESD